MRLDRPVPLDGARPVEDWTWAQARANFVLVGPLSGSDWQIEGPTLRGESEQHHSTLRFFLTDGERRIRAKQYYHDWWIPTIPDISLRTPGTPLPFGDQSVSFVGRDYRRNPASCGHLLGTGVEFSVEQGQLVTEDWATLWSSLGALHPLVLPAARETSFARRNYWNRWGRVDGPWDSTEISSLTWKDADAAAMEHAEWALSAEQASALPGRLDSLGFRAGPQGDEVQFVSRWTDSLDTSAWLRVLRAPPEAWRPLMDASEVNRPRWKEVDLDGCNVERATMDPQVGNWFYAWRDGTKAYELHLRARQGLHAEVADILAADLMD